MRRLCRLDQLEEGRLVALDNVPDADAAPGRDESARAASPDIGPPDEVDSFLALRAGADVRIWHNVCPHAGRRLDWAPGRFLRDGEHLVCAHHGAVFELARGLCVNGPCRGQSLAALDVEVREGEVWIADAEA